VSEQEQIERTPWMAVCVCMGIDACVSAAVVGLVATGCRKVSD
jgi:negative regulator of sigma E activity